MTLSELSQQFLGYHVEAANKDSTQQTTRNILTNHILPALGHLDIKTLSRLDIVAWRAQQLKKVGKKTVRNRLAVLNRMLEFAVELEYLTAFPRVRQDSGALPDPVWLEKSDLNKLLAAADPFWRSMMTIVANTGMRIGEARGLAWDHVDLVRKTLRIKQACAGYSRLLTAPKNGKPRTIPLNNTACSELMGLRRIGPFVFGVDPKGLVLGYNAARDAMRQAVHQAGLGARDIGWHSLRHTFASHMAMRGCPLRTLQELLGHSSLQMVLRYAHVAPSATHSAVVLLDDSPEK